MSIDDLAYYGVREPYPDHDRRSPVEEGIVAGIGGGGFTLDGLIADVMSKIDESDFALVPKCPTERQIGGLAGEIMNWLDTHGAGRPTARKLFRQLELAGVEIPAWLRDHPSLQKLDDLVAKPVRTEIIYRAAVEAGATTTAG